MALIVLMLVAWRQYGTIPRAGELALIMLNSDLVVALLAFEILQVGIIAK